MDNLRVLTVYLSTHLKVKINDQTTFLKLTNHYQSLNSIGAIGHDLKSICYFLQFLPFDFQLDDLDLDLGQGHSNQIGG